MNAIRIKKRIDSEMLNLPELRPFLGKQVEIVVTEESPVEPGVEDRWRPLVDIAGKDLVDPEAYKELRAASTMGLRGRWDENPDEEGAGEKETR
jgi:hypothetical protein